MRPRIAELFRLQFPTINLGKVSEIADNWTQDGRFKEGLKEIEIIEKKWGPIGIWSAKYDEKRLFSFHYPKKYDSIYREFKYIYMDLLTGHPEIPRVTRDIVLDSTMHVENCLKILCQKKDLKNYEKKWIVPLVKLCKTYLEPNLRSRLMLLGTEVSNPSKHKYDVGSDEPLFSAADAIATYLCCRKLGYELLSACGEISEVIKSYETGPYLGIEIYL